VIPIRVSDFAKALGAAPPAQAASDVLTSAALDSRTVRKGGVFFARKGEKDDGRRYVDKALESGAALVVSEPGVDPGPRTLVVESPLAALRTLAGLVRAASPAVVVAVAGSVGKTTTKDLIAGLLSPTRRIVASEKSFNNDVGVPLTLCRIDLNVDVVVVEIGSNHPGELRPLAELARPDRAVLTAIGAEHLEGFGDLDGVLEEELEVARALKPGGVLYVNADDAALASARYPDGVVVERVGFAAAAARRAIGVERSDGAPALRLSPGGPEIAAPSFPFAFVRSNLLLAAAVASDLGVSEEALAAAAPGLKPSAMRGEARRCGAALVLVDCYNANPLSAERALEELSRREGRRVAVLGDMLELGPDAPRFHAELGRKTALAGVRDAVFVGAHGEDFRRGFGAAGSLTLRKSAADAVEDFRGLVGEPGTVLLKASRGVGLERVLEVCR
jgi:UDP-N-acetylmuramoyl-tripeptide--D-alanyl-D-alanine ligase